MQPAFKNLGDLTEAVDDRAFELLPIGKPQDRYDAIKEDARKYHDAQAASVDANNARNAEVRDLDFKIGAYERDKARPGMAWTTEDQETLDKLKSRRDKSAAKRT